MHELSIASAVMDSVLEFARSHSVTQVLKVRVAVGELTHLEGEQLKFCYQAISENTLLADSALEIETVPAQVSCPGCSYQGPPKYWADALAKTDLPTLECPQCGQTVDVAQGQECAIRAIQYLN